MNRNGDGVAAFEDNLAVFAVFAGHEAPAARVDPEDFGGLVAVLGVHASGRLARRADIEAVRLAYVHVLVRVLGDARADDREVLLRLAARRASIDKRGAARDQLAVTDEPRPHLFPCNLTGCRHAASPDSVWPIY